VEAETPRLESTTNAQAFTLVRDSLRAAAQNRGKEGLKRDPWEDPLNINPQRRFVQAVK